MVNNNNRGPVGSQNVIDDYTDLSADWGHAWFLPHHGDHQFAGNYASLMMSS